MSAAAEADVSPESDLVTARPKRPRHPIWSLPSRSSQQASPLRAEAADIDLEPAAAVSTSQTITLTTSWRWRRTGPFWTSRMRTRTRHRPP